MDRSGIQSRWKNVQRAVDVAATTAVLAVGVMIVINAYSPGRANSAQPRAIDRTVRIPEEPIRLETTSPKGRQDAPAVLIEFTDFECPFCRRFVQQVLPQIEATFIAGGQLQVHVKHLPLPKHAAAGPAAVAVECAAKQRMFWPMHDRLFAGPELSVAGLIEDARALGLDAGSFAACQNDSSIEVILRSDADLAKRLNVASTPLFLLGVKRGDKVQVTESLSGARPFEDFREAIQRTLAAVGKPLG